MSPLTQAKIAQIKLLEKKADRASVLIVVDILKNDTDSAVRAAAATALGNIGDEVALPALVLTSQDSNSQIASAALKAIEIFRTNNQNRQEEKKKKLDDAETNYSPDYGGG